MAKPCNYQLAGEDTWMSESDFKKRLNDGLLDRLLTENNIKIPGIKPLKESAPRAVEQTAPSSSVVAQEREATAVDARKSIPKQFNEGYVEVEGREKGRTYTGYSIKVNEGNNTADIKLPNGKELKNQPIIQLEGVMGGESRLSVMADGGTRITIPSQSELDAKAEKQRMIDEENQAPKEKKEVKRKNIKNFKELESKDALKMAEKLKFSPNEFDGTEIFDKVEGLVEFDEKVTINGRSYGTDKNKPVSRVIEKLVDAKLISPREGEILTEAFEAKKDAYWKAKNNAAKEGFNKKIDDMAERLKRPSGTKSTINPFDFLPVSLRNKAIDLFADLVKKGAGAGIDVVSAFQRAFYDTIIPAIQSGRITEEEANRLESEMLKQNTSDIEKEARILEETPDLRTQAKFRTEAQRKITKELKKKRPKNSEELNLLVRKMMNDGLIDTKADIIEPVMNGSRDLYLNPLNEIEQAALRLYGRDLEDSITDLNRKIVNAVQDGKPSRIYDDEKAKLESDKIAYVDVMLDDSLVTGRLFSFRRELETSRMTFEEMMVNAQSRAENSNGILSEETKAKLKKIADKFAEIDAKVKEKEAEVMAEAEREAFQNIVDDINDKGVDVEPETKTIKEKAKKIADSLRRNKIHRPGMFSVASPGSIAFDIAVEAAATAIEASGSVISAVSKALSAIRDTNWYRGLSSDEQKRADSELTNYIKGYSSEMISSSDGSLKIPISLIRNFVASGVNTIEELVEKVTNELEFISPETMFTERQVRDAITGYGKYIKKTKSEISETIANLKSVGKMISSLEDLQAKIRREKNPAKKKELSDREIYLKAQIKAILNTIPVSPEEEITINDNRLIDKKNRLREKKYQLEQIRQSGVRPERRRRAQPVSDARIEELMEEIAEIQEEINQFPYSQEQLQEIENRRLEQYKKRQKKMIEDLQRRLREKDFSKKTPKSLELDEEATELRNERQRLRDEYEAELEAIELENRSIGQKILDGVVGAVNDLKSLSLSADMSAFRQGGFIMADLMFSDPKSVGLFIKRVFTLAGIVPDVNPLTNPLEFGKRAGKSLVDKDNGKKLYEAIELDRKQSEDYQLMKDAGLFLQEETAVMSKKEEAFAASLAKKIPLIGQQFKIKGITVPGLDILGRGERSFSAINDLRVAAFMQGVRKLREAGISFKDNPDAYKNWARHVNAMSGRGVGSDTKRGRLFEKAAPFLNIPFVSARFLKSRFDLSVLSPTFWAKYYMLPREVKLLAARQVVAANAYMAGTTYLGYLALGATLALFKDANDDDEEYEELTPEEDEDVWKFTTDMFSSNFMKLTQGDVSLDFLAGFSQADVFIARMTPWIGGYKRMPDGELIELNTKYNGPTLFSVPIDFATSKMVPWAQYLMKKSKEIVKKPEEGEVVEEVKEEDKSQKKIQDYFLPLSVILARDLAKQKNISTAEYIALNALSFFGIGNVNVNTFGKKEEKETGGGESDVFGGGSEDIFGGGESDVFGGGSNDPFK